MKKLIATVIFCLAICISAFAQSPLAELDKIKQLKLLESTREDVKRIFRDYKKDADKEDSEDTEDSGEYEEEEVEVDHISTKNMTIRFHYSLGSCSDDEEEEWNVPKGTVTEI